MKELLALLPETKRKLLLFLCEHKDEFRLRSDDFRLRTIFGISEETGMAFITVRKAVREFESLGLVKVYKAGRAKVVVPTEKLKDICEMLQKGERR